MFVYRITLAKYSGKLIASGRAARWNPNDVKMIYTASSRSLACLENVVHRDKIGLSQLFDLMTIECPDHIKIRTIGIEELPVNWAEFDQMHKSQIIGAKWIRDNETCILKVPSSIIEDEVNYLLNPAHEDFKLIRVINTRPFVFDGRIK